MIIKRIPNHRTVDPGGELQRVCETQWEAIDCCCPSCQVNSAIGRPIATTLASHTYCALDPEGILQLLQETLHHCDGQSRMFLLGKKVVKRRSLREGGAVKVKPIGSPRAPLSSKKVLNLVTLWKVTACPHGGGRPIVEASTFTISLVLFSERYLRKQSESSEE